MYSTRKQISLIFFTALYLASGVCEAADEGIKFYSKYNVKDSYANFGLEIQNKSGNILLYDLRAIVQGNGAPLERYDYGDEVGPWRVRLPGVDTLLEKGDTFNSADLVVAYVKMGVAAETGNAGGFLAALNNFVSATQDASKYEEQAKKFNEVQMFFTGSPVGIVLPYQSAYIGLGAFDVEENSFAKPYVTTRTVEYLGGVSSDMIVIAPITFSSDYAGGHKRSIDEIVAEERNCFKRLANIEDVMERPSEKAELESCLKTSLRLGVALSFKPSKAMFAPWFGSYGNFVAMQPSLNITGATLPGTDAAEILTSLDRLLQRLDYHQDNFEKSQILTLSGIRHKLHDCGMGYNTNSICLEVSGKAMHCEFGASDEIECVRTPLVRYPSRAP